MVIINDCKTNPRRRKLDGDGPPVHKLVCREKKPVNKLLRQFIAVSEFQSVLVERDVFAE